MSTYFIADLHLTADRPDTLRAFDQFIENQAIGADALYILGDLFEAWIGDDDPSPLSRHVIHQLRRLSDSGTAVFFQHGNRDFLIGRRFSRESGAQLLGDDQVINLYGEQVLVLHGDALCVDDIAYQKFRRRVRHPLVRWLLVHLPLSRRLKIAADWRARSAAKNSNKSDAIMDVSPAEIPRRMQLHGVRTMIHGHTHRPARHPLQVDGKPAERIVVGDWGPNTWIVRANAHERVLEQLTPAPITPGEASSGGTALT